MTYREKKFSGMRKKPKYRNQFSDYNGNQYHSKFESQVAQDLDFRLKAGELTEVKRQVKIPLDVNGEHITNYFIDFVAIRKDGVQEYIEVKGFVTELWKFKWRLFEVLYKDKVEKGEIELVVIKR